MTEAVLKPPRANLTKFVHKPYLLVTMAGYIQRGYRELLDGRLFRPDSEQRPLVSKFTTVAIVKLCRHNFTQIANFIIFFCVYYFL